MNDPLYSFLSARVDKELEALSSVPGLPLPEVAELGRGLLFSRLRDLAEPVVEAWLQEELVRLSPAVVLSPVSATRCWNTRRQSDQYDEFLIKDWRQTT